ncbi:hypothetical protein AB6A40_005548 [Gnathostoma spinigerum]|uniref:Uncharacterized protein n=1 Tax=Gnathostoma spinigerum TaxID=75299 RepID=A0ABD6EFR3_9BILA
MGDDGDKVNDDYGISNATWRRDVIHILGNKCVIDIPLGYPCCFIRMRNHDTVLSLIFFTLLLKKKKCVSEKYFYP